MAHQLTVRDNGFVEMFSGSNLTPWHKLGQRIEGLATAEEAIKLAGLDWDVALEPVFVRGNELKENKAVVRQDNGNVLGIVGNKYCPIQNRFNLSDIDTIIGEGQAVYDTAGSLFGGKRIWIMAKLKGSLFIESNPEDLINKMLLLSSSHDGSGSKVMGLVTDRVVCANTLSIAMSGITNQIKIKHTKNHASKSEQAGKILGLANAYFDDLQGVINILSKQSMNQGEMISFTEKLIPSVKEEDSTRTLNIRNEIVDLFHSGKGNLGKSRWDALNAVTEYVDHNRATRTKQNGNAEENRFASVLFGSGANLKEKAFNLLIA